jgi:hypothetical protein
MENVKNQKIVGVRQITIYPRNSTTKKKRGGQEYSDHQKYHILSPHVHGSRHVRQLLTTCASRPHVVLLMFLKDNIVLDRTTVECEDSKSDNGCLVHMLGLSFLLSVLLYNHIYLLIVVPFGPVFYFVAGCFVMKLPQSL